MKSTAQIKPGRAFTYRGPTDREETAQKLAEKAEGLKLVGKYDAADSAAKAAERLRRERKAMEPMPMTLVQALGGVRDPIAVLVKAKDLTVAHGWTARDLRLYQEGGTVQLSGGCDLDRVDCTRVDNKPEWVDMRIRGRHAWERAESECAHDLWPQVSCVIMGRAGVSRACRQIGRDTPRGREMLRENLLASLDAAQAYLGVA